MILNTTEDIKIFGVVVGGVRCCCFRCGCGRCTLLLFSVSAVYVAAVFGVGLGGVRC